MISDMFSHVRLEGYNRNGEIYILSLAASSNCVGFLQLGHLHWLQPSLCFQLHSDGIRLEVDLQNSCSSRVRCEWGHALHSKGA